MVLHCGSIVHTECVSAEFGHCMCAELWRSVKVFSLSTNSEQSWVINFQIDKKNCDEWEKVKVICTLCKFSTINVTNRNA